jgi:hypothetical protein
VTGGDDEERDHGADDLDELGLGVDRLGAGSWGEERVQRGGAGERRKEEGKGEGEREGGRETGQTADSGDLEDLGDHEADEDVGVRDEVRREGDERRIDAEADAVADVGDGGGGDVAEGEAAFDEGDGALGVVELHEVARLREKGRRERGSAGRRRGETFMASALTRRTIFVLSCSKRGNTRRKSTYSVSCCSMSRPRSIFVTKRTSSLSIRAISSSLVNESSIVNVFFASSKR